MLVYPRLQKHLLCSDLDLAKVCVWGSARLGGGGGGENPVWLAPSLKLLPQPTQPGPLVHQHPSRRELHGEVFGPGDWRVADDRAPFT